MNKSPVGRPKISSAAGVYAIREGHIDRIYLPVLPFIDRSDISFPFALGEDIFEASIVKFDRNVLCIGFGWSKLIFGGSKLIFGGSKLMRDHSTPSGMAP